MEFDVNMYFRAPYLGAFPYRTENIDTLLKGKDSVQHRENGILVTLKGMYCLEVGDEKTMFDDINNESADAFFGRLSGNSNSKDGLEVVVNPQIQMFMTANSESGENPLIWYEKGRKVCHFLAFEGEDDKVYLS